MTNARPSTPQVPQSHRLVVLRRSIAVLIGFASLVVIVGLWNSREHIPDDWAEGFWWIYVFQALVAVALGAGAAVLWYPKGRGGAWRWVLRGAVAGMVAVFGLILLGAVAGSF